MVKLNNRVCSLEKENTFASVAKKINEYKSLNPDCKLISLGVGDVSKPIVKSVIEAMHKAVDELSDMDTFKGYGSPTGYDFLKDKILENDYNGLGFSKDEVYISVGTKTDCTNILELFDIDSKICIANPMYPIYRDGASCLNRNFIVIDALEEDNFIAKIPNEKFDLIYICSPSNPIGTALSYDELVKWVDYAIENDSVILYDNVYNSFITSKDVPKSIYEISGAKKVAIEFRSFSKSASFTGVRCSYYVIPNDISNGINDLWKNRTINRFNGADYIAQRGAEATYLEESLESLKKDIEYYLGNSKYLLEELKKLGFKVWGGVYSPFIWVKTKDGMSSWQFFDFLLKELNIIIIPGIIFGSNGDQFFRVSALGERKYLEEAVERLRKYYEK